MSENETNRGMIVDKKKRKKEEDNNNNRRVSNVVSKKVEGSGNRNQNLFFNIQSDQSWSSCIIQKKVEWVVAEGCKNLCF